MTEHQVKNISVVCSICVLAAGRDGNGKGEKIGSQVPGEKMRISVRFTPNTSACASVTALALRRLIGAG